MKQSAGQGTFTNGTREFKTYGSIKLHPSTALWHYEDVAAMYLITAAFQQYRGVVVMVVVTRHDKLTDAQPMLCGAPRKGKTQRRQTYRNEQTAGQRVSGRFSQTGFS